jgi:hypothetical protein
MSLWCQYQTKHAFTNSANRAVINSAIALGSQLGRGPVAGRSLGIPRNSGWGFCSLHSCRSDGVNAEVAGCLTIYLLARVWTAVAVGLGHCDIRAEKSSLLFSSSSISPEWRK